MGGNTRLLLVTNLFATGLYSQYLAKGKAFVDEFEQLLAQTGKLKIFDLGKTMNIDLHDINFWRSSLKLVEKDIETFIDYSDQ